MKHAYTRKEISYDGTFPCSQATEWELTRMGIEVNPPPIKHPQVEDLNLNTTEGRVLHRLWLKK